MTGESAQKLGCPSTHLYHDQIGDQIDVLIDPGVQKANLMCLVTNLEVEFGRHFGLLAIRMPIGTS